MTDRPYDELRCIWCSRPLTDATASMEEDVIACACGVTYAAEFIADAEGDDATRERWDGARSRASGYTVTRDGDSLTITETWLGGVR